MTDKNEALLKPARPPRKILSKVPDLVAEVAPPVSVPTSPEAMAAELTRALDMQLQQNELDAVRVEVNAQMPTDMKNVDGNLEQELIKLRAAFKKQEVELAELRTVQSNVITANYREARAGEYGQEPIAVIDKAGHVWPFTTNNNDRISLLKMAVTYVYNQKDLDFALAQAQKIRENTADINQQIIGAPLARGVAIPRHVEAAQTFQGMEVKGSSLLAVHPEKYDLAVNANKF